MVLLAGTLRRPVWCSQHLVLVCHIKDSAPTQARGVGMLSSSERYIHDGIAGPTVNRQLRQPKGGR